MKGFSPRRMLVGLGLLVSAMLVGPVSHGAASPGADLPMAPSHRSTPAKAPRVEIFSSPSCQYCVQAKAYFREKGVAYIDYDVSRDAVAAARMFPLNPRGILPFVIIQGKAVVGFVPDVYDRLLTGAAP